MPFKIKENMLVSSISYTKHVVIQNKFWIKDHNRKCLILHQIHILKPCVKNMTLVSVQ
jgi:hypothetical protein